MTRQPIVSVVIPAHGRGRSLRATLTALAAQTVQDFEVVVVDDGSPEPVTRDICPPGANFDLRIIRQENAGPAAARNRGAREAKGEILAFTDDDCLPRPEWLSVLTGAIATHPDALVGSLTFNGLPDNSWSATSHLIIDLVYDHFNRDPANAYFLASNNLACCRDLFIELGGFDTDFPRAGAEDRDFCDRWRMTKRPIRLVRQDLVEHRHGHTFRKFVDLHYRYGCGAFLYQAKRKERASGTMTDDLTFHRSLPREVAIKLRGLTTSSKVTALFSLVCWQAANALGFVAAMLMGHSETAGHRNK